MPNCHIRLPIRSKISMSDASRCFKVLTDTRRYFKIRLFWPVTNASKLDRDLPLAFLAFRMFESGSPGRPSRTTVQIALYITWLASNILLVLNLDFCLFNICSALCGFWQRHSRAGRSVWLSEATPSGFVESASHARCTLQALLSWSIVVPLKVRVEWFHLLRSY